jgi:hypothetical protein
MGNCNWINTNNNNNNCNCNTQNNNNCNCNTQNYNTQTCNTTKNYNNQATTTQNDCCCCAGSFRRALALLSDPVLSQYINFDTFAFVSQQISVGGYLANQIGDAYTPAIDTSLDDNLIYDDTPASFLCVDCNLVKISGVTSFYLVRNPNTGAAGGALVAPEATEGDLNYLSLCELIAVKFPIITANFTANPVLANECGTTCNISNWASFKTYFRSFLDKNNNCNTSNTCDDCCCSNDILNQVNSCVGPRGANINVVAGSWFGEGVEVLGNIGCVLVLTDNTLRNAADTDDVDPNIFFVCVDDVAALNA